MLRTPQLNGFRFFALSVTGLGALMVVSAILMTGSADRANAQQATPTPAELPSETPTATPTEIPSDTPTPTATATPAASESPTPTATPRTAVAAVVQLPATGGSPGSDAGIPALGVILGGLALAGTGASLIAVARRRQG